MSYYGSDPFLKYSGGAECIRGPEPIHKPQSEGEFQYGSFIGIFSFNQEITAAKLLSANRINDNILKMFNPFRGIGIVKYTGSYGFQQTFTLEMK